MLLPGRKQNWVRIARIAGELVGIEVSEKPELRNYRYNDSAVCTKTFDSGTMPQRQVDE